MIPLSTCCSQCLSLRQNAASNLAKHIGISSPVQPNSSTIRPLSRSYKNSSLNCPSRIKRLVSNSAPISVFDSDVNPLKNGLNRRWWSNTLCRFWSLRLISESSRTIQRWPTRLRSSSVTVLACAFRVSDGSANEGRLPRFSIRRSQSRTSGCRRRFRLDGRRHKYPM